jgi:microcystin-dependent protein
MSNVSETATFDAGVYQIETGDSVIGGPTGIANKQAIALANRTKYLKQHVDTAEADIIAAAASLTDKETRIALIEAAKFQLIGNNFVRGIVTVNSGSPMIVPATAYGKLTILDVPGTSVTALLPTLTGLTVGARFDILIIDSSGSRKTAKITFSTVDGTVTGNLLDFSVGDTVAFIVTGAGTWAIMNGFKQSDCGAIGEVKYFGVSSPPTGYIAADGAAVSRTTYARLFAFYGVTHGVGNGTTTFNVPDGRGEFIRGWDNGRGVDSGRTFGSFQADIIKNHTHPYIDVTDTAAGGIATGGAASFSSVSKTTSNNTGGSAVETRPRNIALLACVKY